jgi:hypothetical protein
MNITKQRLKQIIKEEMHKLANPIDEKLTKKEKERKGELEDELKDLKHK